MNYEPLGILKVHALSKTKSFQNNMQKPNRTLLIENGKAYEKR